MRIFSILKELLKKYSESNKKILNTIQKICKMWSIDWAPIQVPLIRRIQTLAISFYVFVFMILPFISLYLTPVCLVSVN